MLHGVCGGWGSRKSQSNIGEIVGWVVVVGRRIPFDHAVVDGMPFAFTNRPDLSVPDLTSHSESRLTCPGYPFGCTCSSHTSRLPFASHPLLRFEYDTPTRATSRLVHRTFGHTSR
jgi:hypothetical protein